VEEIRIVLPIPSQRANAIEKDDVAADCQAARGMPSVANSLYRYGEPDHNPLEGLEDEDLMRMDRDIAQRMQAQDTTLNSATVWGDMASLVPPTASTQRGEEEEDNDDDDEDRHGRSKQHQI
jgi:hypothetical protein